MTGLEPTAFGTQIVSWVDAPDLYLVVGVDTQGRVFTSYDNGKLWTWRTVVGKIVEVTRLKENGAFLAKALDGSFSTSPDGIIWTCRSAPLQEGEK